jgi:hypothetical protein
MGLALTCGAASGLLTGATELLELVSQAAKDKAIRPPIRGNATRLAPQRAVITVTRVTGVAPFNFIASTLQRRPGFARLRAIPDQYA